MSEVDCPFQMTADTGSWDRRIHRAERLAAENGAAASLLGFYARLLRQQKSVYDSFKRRGPHGSIEADVSLVARLGLAIVKEVAGDGPDQLVAEAHRLLEAGESTREELLLAYWPDRSDQLFFPRALLQPYAQWLAESGTQPIASTSASADNRCPRCGGTPQLSILEPAGAMSVDGGSRRLQCADCLTTWPFRRVVCPSCGEEDERKLGYYRSPALAHVRLDVCASCGRYLKTIDLAQLGLAVPLVDEVAAAPLDMWARDQGYEKIELNLVGL